MGEQKRRFFEGNSATATFIGAESVFVGNVRGAGDFVVSGEVSTCPSREAGTASFMRTKPSSPARSPEASSSGTNWKSAIPQ
jgi:hypothetical protein